MSAPRVPPVPPNKAGELDKSSPTAHRKVEKVEKISKVDEADNESRARQKFRAFVEAEPEAPSNLPSPFSLFSVTEEGPSTVSLLRSAPRGMASPPPAPPTANDSWIAEAAETAVPSPSYSIPPSAAIVGFSADDEGSDPPLPRSQQFWGSVNGSADYSNASQDQPQMEETPRSSSRVFASEEEERKGKKTEKKESVSEDEPAGPQKKQGKKGALETDEESLFGPQGKPRGKKRDELLAKRLGEPAASPFPAKEKDGEKEEEESLLWSEEGGLMPRGAGMEGVVSKGKNKPGYVGPLAHTQALDFRGPLPADEKGSPRSLPEGARLKRSLEVGEEVKKEDREFREPLELKKSKISDKEEREGKGRQQKHAEKQEALQIDSPTLTQLPGFAIPIAGAAAAAASPYLGPEALAVYFHMIGTITAMVSPRGDSRTEFVLNAPQFAGSKFYGATISIERYSTAPYQINIRLTGSNDAVNAFNQNLPNLLAAFQNGKFSFTVNRIEAVYEKPLFRRKSAAGDKGDQGFGSGPGK